MGLVLIVLTAIELATLLLGLHQFLSWHVFVGFVLLPPLALKLASTGWRFARYYTRNPDYRLKGAPQLLMRAIAPLLVALTVILFGSGVVMGLTHGHTQQIARRLHGPASVGWLILLGLHVLVYLGRALRSARADVEPATRPEAEGARFRFSLVAAALVAGVALGVGTLSIQGHWLHLPAKHEHGGE